MIQQRSDQILEEGRQQDIPDTQTQNTQYTQNYNHPFEWSRVLENISVVALQKFTSQSIGILSDKQIIMLNVRTCKIERKIKPNNKATCITILNQYQNYSESQSPTHIIPKKKVKSLCVQFFTGHFDGTITLWVIQNNKVKKMRVFTDIEPSNRRPVSCLNVMSFKQHLPAPQKRHCSEKLQRWRGSTQQHQKTQVQVVVQYVLLSGHQNGNVKQWNILTGQCLKEIETKHNGILFCVASIQETVLTGGYDNIQVHQPQRANSLPPFSSFQQQSSCQATSTNQIYDKVQSNFYEDSKTSEGQNFPFSASQSRKKSWSNQREEERSRHIKKEFKVIHKGFANYQIKPNYTQKEEKIVRNMIALGSNQIISHGFTNDVTEWKLESNKMTKKIYTGHTDNVKCIEKLNGSSFVTGGRDSNVIIWDNNTKSNQIYEGAHSQPVSSLSAIDDKSFVSSGEDNQILFWKQSK
ncbi:WD domain, G-beta repeat protein (macronuclear) [Tetrahymena thermophila SB210]|uniref:WD domain, G-beta repeat protein n=1 Tax=Tetrahymena thermophila (strain SB210) TaxID=312017 RepID=I7MAT2_TETTS|nr:WD domain, G-beta repeat protein [Tetrahymena thermophila SB210]EAS06097.2 WD domain, G-beta repeat protein [Tetrahymena thermophila SB210]|eukprot:XP_001026342.2 WD domain, G-beta repeat protein [Tetrahymena thermophila SB210]